MLTESQVARWQRTRAKGRSRVLPEQWLMWTVGIGMGAPTARAAVRGGAAAAGAYWSDGAALSHLAFALVFGALMTHLFGFLSWNRMERLCEATGKGVGPPRKADGHPE